MAKKKITYEIGYTIDKNDLSNITRELARIEKLGNLTTKNSLDNSIKTAANSAKQLSQIIDNSWNDKLDKFDLTKFNESIKKSYGNLSGLKNSLNGVDTNVFDQLTNKILGTNLQLKQSSKLLDKMSVTMANTVRFAITSRIVNNLADSISGAYDFSVKLDTSLNDIRIVTGKTADEMARFAVEANRAAKTLGASTRDYTEGALIYYQQGLSDAETAARTETTLKAANVTRQSAQEVSEQLTAVWNGYRVQAEETELYVDKLAAVAASTAADLEELSTGMSKVASSASLMGVDIDQLNAQLSTIVSVSRQAPESVGTALRTIYARMADIEAGVDEETTLGSYTKEMAELGVNVLDADGKLRDMGEVIEEIGNKWKGMSREQQIALSQSMAGTRQYNNLLSLFDNWDQYTKALETSRNAAGTLQKQQDTYMESTRAHLQQLRDEAETTYMLLFDQGAIKAFTDVAIEALSIINTNINGIGGGLTSIFNIGTQIATLFSGKITQSLVRMASNWEGFLDTREKVKNIEDISNELAKGYNEKGIQISNSYIQEQAKTVQNLLKNRRNLTNEEYNSIAAAAERLAYLKQERDIYRKAVTDAAGEGITTSVDAEVRVHKMVEDRYQWAEKTRKIYEEISKLDGRKIIQEEKKENLAKSILDLNQNDSRLQEISNNILEKSKITAQDKLYIEKIKVEKEREYGEELKKNKRYMEALRDAEQETDVKRDYDISELDKYNKEQNERIEKLGKVEKTVRIISGSATAITSLLGGINTFNKEGATGADKANASWTALTGTIAGVAGAIDPAYGAIASAVSMGVKGILDITGAWSWFEDQLKSTKEKIEEVNKELLNFRTTAATSLNTLGNNKKVIDFLEEGQQRFLELQNLADKGLLTEELRTEYDSYLDKVQEYNQEALISYDEQGNRLTANRKVIEETVEKIKEQNELLLSQTYSQENWEKFIKNTEKYRDLRQQQWYDFQAGYRENLFGIAMSDSSILNRSAISQVADVSNWDIDSNNPELWRENALKIEAPNQEAYEKFVDEYYQELIKIKNKKEKDYQSTVWNFDTNTFLNFLKYGEDKTVYEEAKNLGISNIDNILESYVNGLNLGAGGYFSTEDVKESVLDITSSLISIFKDDNAKDVYQQIFDIQEKNIDKFAEEYENLLIERINAFLSNIKDSETFNAIKNILPSLFGLESVDAQWNTSTNTAVLNNITTLGGSFAEKIAEGFGKDDSAKTAIQQYIKKGFSEADLQQVNFDNVVKKINLMLNDAIAKDNGINMEEIVSKAINSEKWESQFERRAKSLDFTTAAVKRYEEEIKDLVKDEYETEKVLDKVALATIDLANDLQATSDKWNDWIEKLKETKDVNIVEYTKTLGEMAESVGKIFNTDISADFVEKYQDKIEAMLEGSEEAFHELQMLAAQDYVMSLGLNETDLANVQDTLNALVDQDLGITIDSQVNIEDALDTLNDLIDAGKITAEQANKALAAIGYEGEIGYREGPETTASTDVYASMLGQNIKVGQFITKTKAEVPYIKSAEKTVSPVNYNRARSTKPSSGRSSKSGGGSSSKPNQIEAISGQTDRYHDINVSLAQTNNELEKVQKETDKTFGGNLINNLNAQIALLNKQIGQTGEKIKIARGEAQELRDKLASSGMTFNPDGTIANYAQVYMAQLNGVNEVIAKYNSMGAASQEAYKDTVENAKKNFEDFKDNLDRYDELLTSFIPDLETQIQDDLNKIIEQNIEKFNMSINLRLNMADAERDWNKFKKQIIDDIEDDDILGNALAGLTDFSSYYKDGGNGVLQANARHVNDILNQLYQMDQGAAASVYGDNRNQALEDLEKYYKQLISDLENLDNLQDEIHQSYLNMMDEAQDKFKEQVNSFELVSELIQHDVNLISLVYGNEAYSKLSAYYDRQENNYNKQLDFQRQQVEFWRNQMDTLDKNSKEWDSARQKWEDAIKQWNDLVEKSIKNIQDEYLNTINTIFQALNGRITDGKGLNYVNEQWNLINKNADQYLDNINSLYEVQKLENKYLEAIDNSDSVGTQRELKSIMDSELKNLRERDRLTEYDIERANKRYEIALKQMALAEAQKNKSSMRLRRDSQGNYRYEYVADQDNVNNIQQELNDMYNSLYNFDKEKYNNNLNKLYSIWTEFQNKIAEAAQINDPTERAERELLLQEQYGELINGIVEQNASIRNNLYDSAFTDLAILYDEDLEHFKEMSEAEKNTLMNDLIPYWTSGVQTMADAFAGEGGFLGVCKDAFEELNQATKDYEDSLDEIQKVASVNFDEIGKGIDKVIGQSEELVKDNDELTQTYNDQLDAIQGVIDQLDTLIDKYSQAKEEAIAASKAAYEYWAQQQDLAAKSAEADTQKMTSNEPAQVTPTVNNTSAPAVASAPHTSQGDGILSIGDRATFTGRYYNSSYGENPSGNLYSGVLNGIVIDRILNNRDFGIHIKSADGRYPDLGWVRKSQLSGYDTGGYTGTWGSDGRLALLHQKELVLNQSDTKNLLDAVGILRQITNSFNHSFLSQMANLSSNSAATSVMEKDKLEQYVHIDASFPNVTNSQEIENAFDNLLNVAVQRINR